MSLPYSAVSKSVLSDSGIPWSCSHFGHSFLITIKINQLFCISCLTVCQCTQTVNSSQSVPSCHKSIVSVGLFS